MSTTQVQSGGARIGSQVVCRPLGPSTTNLQQRVPSRGPQEVPAFGPYFQQPNLGGRGIGVNPMVIGGYFK